MPRTGTKRLGKSGKVEAQIACHSECFEITARVRATGFRRMNIDVIAGLAASEQGDHLAGHGVVTAEDRADVEQNRRICPPIMGQLRFHALPAIGKVEPYPTGR